MWSMRNQLFVNISFSRFVPFFNLLFYLKFIFSIFFLTISLFKWRFCTFIILPFLIPFRPFLSTKFPSGILKNVLRQRDRAWESDPFFVDWLLCVSCLVCTVLDCSNLASDANVLFCQNQSSVTPITLPCMSSRPLSVLTILELLHVYIYIYIYMCLQQGQA